MTKIKAQKRSLDDVERDITSEESIPFTKTPFINPDNDTFQRTFTASVDQSVHVQRNMESHVQESDPTVSKSSNGLGTQERSIPPVKRQRSQTGTPDTYAKDSTVQEPDRWDIPFGLGWTAFAGDNHESDTLRDFTDIVAERFHVPAHVQWMAKNCNEGLMLAQISEGICYFDSSLSRCWRLAFTPSEARKRCKEGLIARAACEELVPSRSPGQPNSEKRLRPRDLNNPHTGSPPAKWFEMDHLGRLNNVLSMRSKAPTSANETYPSSITFSNQHFILTSHGTTTDEPGHQPQTLAVSDNLDPADAMVLDPVELESTELESMEL